ncbi:deoxyribonuclease I [Pyxidicoccus parkwayensis]|jgi:endonuclease/exonuclease/phosphatase family metal-dependent hydrolase|uniref:Deoxyribonuclease I n=1 Tax=Pyxidicoccus parkwayensis TaxID=2813578 RepID=A0ABX7NY16_9BACT|nr:deoxyribonuclease I [Pyxidicoccus parkwaysis]QSQ22372.1 deoxyribonuclease I [Pyxidicoccus parkwaysis]
MRLPSFLLHAVVLVALAVPSLAQAASYLRVVSWNLRHEGWTAEQTYTDDAKQLWTQFGSNSTSNNGCDLVFLQEVMNTDVMPALAQALTQVSGVTWNYAQTPLIGRSSYKEIYAVLYRTDTVSLLSSTVYSDPSDLFEREPQIVKVRHTPTGADYTFINWHAIWGTAAERDVEVRNIDTVFKSVQDGSTSDQDVILLGDHNMACTGASWTELAGLSPAVTCKLDVASTLNTSGGFVSAYDHFWMQATYVTEFSSSGRDYVANTTDFVTRLSDHAPVYLSLYSSSDTD